MFKIGDKVISPYLYGVVTEVIDESSICIQGSYYYPTKDFVLLQEVGKLSEGITFNVGDYKVVSKYSSDISVGVIQELYGPSALVDYGSHKRWIWFPQLQLVL